MEKLESLTQISTNAGKCADPDDLDLIAVGKNFKGNRGNGCTFDQFNKVADLGVIELLQGQVLTEGIHDVNRGSCHECNLKGANH